MTFQIMHGQNPRTCTCYFRYTCPPYTKCKFSCRKSGFSISFKLSNSSQTPPKMHFFSYPSLVTNFHIKYNIYNWLFIQFSCNYCVDMSFVMVKAICLIIGVSLNMHATLLPKPIKLGLKKLQTGNYIINTFLILKNIQTLQLE